MWQINRQSINNVCTSWNKGVRRILNLPHDAHTLLLGLLLKQNHIKINSRNSMSLTVQLLSICIVTVLIFFIILLL